MTISVVVPAHNSTTLGLTLASLAAQTYPSSLMEVVVVDDGSTRPVELGSVVPEHTTLLRVERGWGRSNAVATAIAASQGKIVYWVDSDVVLFPDNVAEHAKWAHFIPEAATIGQKGLVPSWDLTPELVYEEVRSGRISERWDLADLQPHWSEKVFSSTDDLNASDGRHFSTHMGACATATREMYDRAGGQDRTLRLGEDTEIAYRLWQSGAVFVPARTARSWHLGVPTIDTNRATVVRFNDVHFAQRMPIPRYRRTADNRAWAVPLMIVVIPVTAETAQAAKDCVDLVLNSTLTDLRVHVVGPWALLQDDRRSVLSDPLIDVRLLREWFREDHRVRFVDEQPIGSFPSPYRVDLHPCVGVDADALRSLYAEIDAARLGMLSYEAPSADLPDITIWANAAVSRSQRHIETPDLLPDAVARLWGAETRAESLPGSFDLRSAPHEGRIVREAPQIAELKLKVDALRNRARSAEQELERLRREHAPDTPSVASRILTPFRRMWNGARRSPRDI